MSGSSCWLTHQRRALGDRDREDGGFKGSFHTNWGTNCTVFSLDVFLHAYLKRNFPFRKPHSNPWPLTIHSFASHLMFSVFTANKRSILSCCGRFEREFRNRTTVCFCVQTNVSSLVSGRCFGKEVWESNHSCWPFPVPSRCALIISMQAVVSMGQRRQPKVHNSPWCDCVSSFFRCPLLCEAKQCCWLLFSGPLPPQTVYQSCGLISSCPLVCTIGRWSHICYLITVFEFDVCSWTRLLSLTCMFVCV